jgi:glutamyl-tRNA synthetase
LCKECDTFGVPKQSERVIHLSETTPGNPISLPGSSYRQKKIFNMSSKPVRVRFAPSPTGALHIGGVRTALYNYLYARKEGGAFVLRLEDTDQKRLVPGAEAYIRDSLRWLGIEPDEYPGTVGKFGPYRQSERKAIYRQYAEQMVEQGKAYYAFDSTEELDRKREEAKASGEHAWKYDHRARLQMRNSLTLPESETHEIVEAGHPHVIRLKVPETEQITFADIIRGQVAFSGSELDDKVLIKEDGMPTYHMANIVDDHRMEISHVIRGEEWLPSTAHHILLYQALGWEPPQFAHLPLILAPTGKGKLSKRHGKKFGMPVFPLAWEAESEEDSFLGFREYGFVPEAVLNFLAFLGWNPGTEQEIFSLEELSEAFSLDKIGKSGARFDYDKAKWFNQQYIQHASDQQIAAWLKPVLEEKGVKAGADRLATFGHLFKERVALLSDFWEQGYYLWKPVESYDEKSIRKRWKPESAALIEGFADALQKVEPFEPDNIGTATQQYMEAKAIKPGALFPFLRLALSGTLKGPGISEMIAFLGKEESLARLRAAPGNFSALAEK